MTTELGGFVDILRGALRDEADPKHAVREKKFLKSNFDHWGVPVPRVRKLTQQTLRVFAIDDHDEVIEIVESLWTQPVYELRLAAVEVLIARRNTLSVTDMPLCEAMLRGARTWALVDPLAINVAGAMALEATGDDASEFDGYFDRWAVDRDVWVRRAAVLSQLPLARTPDGDPSRFFGYADALLEDPRVVIRKAIGQVLREMGRRRPEVVYAWLRPRLDRSSGVTMREAVKYLDEAQRDEIVTAFWDR